jgi:aquaporin Z
MGGGSESRAAFDMYVAEFIGTAALLAGGLSLVIFMFGEGTPMARVLPNEALRRSVTGFLFGSIGAAIALSPVGRVSGAHLNPAVTIGFRLMGKLESGLGLGYIAAQLAGAVAGCVPLLAWGAMGRSISFGATLPGPGYATSTVLLGEVLTTFGLVTMLCVFLAAPPFRRFTPFAIPFLYAIMVPLEASISGTSTNPARTFGPAVISGQWRGWWIYWVGPLLGMLAAILVCSSFASRIEVAKLYHFESDHGGVFRRMRERRLARRERRQALRAGSAMER